MITHRFSRIFFLLLLAVTLIGAGPSPADAQKKTKGKAKPAVEQPKKEDPDQEAVKSDEPATPPPQVTPATGGTVSWLRKYIDQKTNLGKLKEVTKDYIVVEDDNVTTLIPITMIHSLKQIKEEDPPLVRLEIRLVSKD